MKNSKEKEIKEFVSKNWDKQSSQIQWYFDSLTTEERELYVSEFRAASFGTSWGEWYLKMAKPPPDPNP